MTCAPNVIPDHYKETREKQKTTKISILTKSGFVVVVVAVYVDVVFLARSSYLIYKSYVKFN